jgi:hypothetical protein
MFQLGSSPFWITSAFIEIRRSIPVFRVTFQEFIQDNR